MKIQIKSLRAVNCGPLKDVNIDFTTNGEPRPITLLAGANGSGKTTVLELIFSLASRVVVGQVGKSEHTALTIAEYAQLDISVDLSTVSIVKASPDGHKELPPNVIRYTSDLKHPREISGGATAQLRTAIATQLGKSIDDADAFLQVGDIIYFPRLRETIGYEGDGVTRFSEEYEWVVRYEPAARYATSIDGYLVWLDYADPERFNKTIQFLNSLNLDGKTFSVSRKALKAVVTTQDGSKHGLSDLSSGEQSVLEMLLELHRRLLPDSIVLIDEIENSLHPAFQHKLGIALKKLQQEIPFQLIATSHSREFLKIFGPENTLILTEF